MELFKLFGTIAVNNSEANSAIDETSGKAESFGSKLKSGISTAAKWGTAIVGGATAAGAALVKFAESSASTADNIDKMSQKIGISREAYQELDFICSQSGTSVDNLQAGMKSLVSAMDGAASGTASNVEQFNRLGISVTNADGSLRNSEDVMWETLSALQSMDNETEKARLATELFGRSGTELLPLLNSEAGSLEEMKQQAHDLGLVLDDELIDNGVSLTDTLDQMKRSFGSIVTQLGASLMPIVEKVAKYVIDNMPKIQALFKRLEPIITNLLDGLLPPLMDLVEQLLPIIFDLIEQLIPPISEIVQSLLPVITDLLSAILPILIKVISTILPPIIQLIEMLIPYIVQFIETLLPPLTQLIESLLPIIGQIIEAVLPILIQLIDTLLPIIIQIIETILPPIIQLIEQLLPIVTQIIEAVLPVIISLLNLLTPILEALMPILQPIFEILLTLLEPLFQLLDIVLPILTTLLQGVASVIDTVVKPIITWVANFLSGVFSGVLDAIMGLIGRVRDAFKGAWEGIKNVWQGAGNFFKSIWEGIKKAFGAVADWFKNIFSKAWQAVKNVFSTGGKIFDGIKDGIVKAFKTVVNAIIRGINKVIAVPFNAINSVLQKIHDISILGVSPFGWVHTFDVPQIPELAKGGVLQKGQVGYLEGDGSEAVVPLEQNTEWTQQVAKQIHEFTVKTKDESKDITPATNLITTIRTEVGERIKNLEATVVAILDVLKQFFPELLDVFDVTMVLDDGTLVAKLTPKIDRQLWVIYKRKERG